MSLNLARFKKPARYAGNEINIVRKEDASSGIKVALCFPDAYEIGMSHLGLKILYSIINSVPQASAERVYAPWADLEAYLRKNNLPLTSLENKRPLKDFDIVGFTLQYELSYTNILNMLDMGGIPLKARDRGDTHPLVIAGGPCSVNPLALEPFIDAFVIGDGEEVMLEIIEAVGAERSAIGKREDLLQGLSKIEGVYVPLVHGAGRQKIKRRIVEDLDKAPYPDAPVVPFASIVHDRAAIEIARGCTRGCRFCQAGMIYRPRRERSLQNVLSLAGRSISNTGYEEVSFTSLSTGDYSGLLPLIRDFNRMCSGSRISVSLPSLRVGSINSDVLKEIKSVRKTGFTIAPEAGTERLRSVINKDFTDGEYEETLKKLFTAGWRNIKLYFMIGLPSETLADLDGIIDMAVRASRRGREITGRVVNVNVGISAFVPKPHTPFQWTGQCRTEELREKQDYLKKAFKKRRINFKGQHVEHSLLEAVFSRAGMECSRLLEEAWRTGCIFDGWSEMFDFGKWLAAAEKTGIDLYEYASRSFSLEEDLPWDFIDTGITRDFLKLEYQRALDQKITSDCHNVCHGCGLECRDRAEGRGQRAEGARDVSPPLKKGDEGGFFHKINVPSSMRVRFSKTGGMRYLSHQELMTAILRALRRAGAPLAYSEGFHPHPKISFGPALAAGIEGLSEYFDIEMTVLMDSTDFLERLNFKLPEGITALNAVLISPKERSLNDLVSRYEYEINIDGESGGPIDSFMKQENCLVQRDEAAVDIRPMVEKAVIRNNVLHLQLVDTDKVKVRLYEILKGMLQKPVEEIQECMIKRVGLYGYNRGAWTEPIEK
ncbi:MAG: TIGR03960 family B12-binding radical SAM protein [Nitrospiraceae bacterium]|nr:MAG: TIGR03960 family B12-binding radical SAM protein [Nitrospiraceae bacterium]